MKYVIIIKWTLSTKANAEVQLVGDRPLSLETHYTADITGNILNITFYYKNSMFLIEKKKNPKNINM